SRQEALAVIKELQNAKNKDPKLETMAKQLQVTAVPLGVIYQQLQQSKNQQNRLLFAFKPVDKEVNSALTLLNASGQKVDQFKSVPVFAVRFAPDKGYVPIQLGGNNQQMIPLFLSKQDALGLLNQVKPKFPQADIQVIDVDGVIKTLEDKNDSWLNQVVLVPSPESREYIRTLPKNNAAKQNNAPSKRR
ncbi:MAG: Tic22 family protein, partial [Sphaerospermopsis kisseleviana]